MPPPVSWHKGARAKSAFVQERCVGPGFALRLLRMVRRSCLTRKRATCRPQCISPSEALGASYFFDLNCLKLHSPLAPQSSIAAAPAFPFIGLLVASPTRFVQSPVCQPSCGKLCDQSSQSRSACASWSHQRSEQLRCSAHEGAEHQLRTTRQHSAARVSAHWSAGLRIRLKV